MKKASTPKSQSAKPAPKAESKPIVETAAAQESPTENRVGSIPDITYKKFFFGSLVIMLLTLWFTGLNVGYNSDEMDMNAYGKANLRYYMTGGKDTSYLGTPKALEPGEDSVYYLLRYYGNAYESVVTIFNRATGIVNGKQEYNSRHMFCQLFAALAILFTGLIVHRMAGWRAALITAWLLFISPTFLGHALFNTKDIPFLTSNIAVIYYIIKFLDELPKVSWKTTLWLMFWFYFNTDTRIGGILLMFYFLMFIGIYLAANKTLYDGVIVNWKDVLIKMFVIGVGGLTLTVLTWPYLLTNPIHNILATLDIVKKFPQKVNINFEGMAIDSTKVPSNFLPKSIFLTIPIFIQLAIVGGIIIYFYNRKKYDWKIGALVLVSSLFPLIFAIVNNIPVYNGWRHFIFIYPGLIVLAGIGLNEILNYFTKLPMKIAFGIVCLAGMARPIIFEIRNHPLEYCYFNEFAGDFKNAYYNYDTDYWQIAVTDGIEWLIRNEHIDKSKDTVTVGTNAFAVVKYYIKRHYPNTKIKVISSGITGRNSLYWQYGIFNTLFVKPDYLENYFPPAQTIHAETVDGLPVNVEVKDTARLDWRALSALKSANHRLADSLYTEYIRTTKDNNAAIYAYISVAKASLNQNEEAIAAANKCMQYHFSTVLDYNCYCGLGIAYANKRQYDLSISNLLNAQKIMPNEHYANDILRQVYQIRRAETGK